MAGNNAYVHAPYYWVSWYCPCPFLLQNYPSIGQLNVGCSAFLIDCVFAIGQKNAEHLFWIECVNLKCLMKLGKASTFLKQVYVCDILRFLSSLNGLSRDEKKLGMTHIQDVLLHCKRVKKFKKSTFLWENTVDYAFFQLRRL